MEGALAARELHSRRAGRNDRGSKRLMDNKENCRSADNRQKICEGKCREMEKGRWKMEDGKWKM